MSTGTEATTAAAGSTTEGAAGTTEAHKAFATPEAHHHGTAPQHAAQVCAGASTGPERMFMEQPLQFQQTAGGSAARPHPQQAQTWSSWGMPQNLNADLGSRQRC